MTRLRKTRGEIDTVVFILRKMTPDEMEKYLHDRFIKDFNFFNRLVAEQEERHNWLRNQPEIRPFLEKVKKFYADLVTDGYIKKDFSLFKYDKIKDWIFAQSRAEYVGILKDLDHHSSKEYSEIFRKWNRAYGNNYEAIISQYLVDPAQKISGRRITNKTAFWIHSDHTKMENILKCLRV